MLPIATEPPTAGLSVTPALRETLLHVVRNMPASPGILSQLGNMLLDLNSDLSGITQLLKRDAALTARVIRISNSAIYNSGEPYGSLEPALARIGFTEVYRLAGLAIVGQLSDQHLALYRVTGTQLRENALLVALVMEAVAGSTHVDPRVAYTAGLLRSTGKIALDRMAKGEFPVNRTLADGEKALVGLTNCAAAEIVLNEWRFPEEIVTAIRDHYLLEASGSKLAHLLNLAAGAAERSGHGLAGETPYWSFTPDTFAAAQVEEGDVNDALARALTVFAEIRAALA